MEIFVLYFYFLYIEKESSSSLFMPSTFSALESVASLLICVNLVQYFAKTLLEDIVKE